METANLALILAFVGFGILIALAGTGSIMGRFRIAD